MIARAEQPADESVGRRDHVMEHCLFLLELRQTPMDRVRVARNYLSQQTQIAEGDCRERVVLRPALDQQIDHVAPRV